MCDAGYSKALDSPPEDACLPIARAADDGETASMVSFVAEVQMSLQVSYNLNREPWTLSPEP